MKIAAERAKSSAGPVLSQRNRDFLFLNIFVLFSHGHVERARILAEAMHAIGEDGEAVHMARAVLRFSEGEWRETLDVLTDLDRISPIERFGSYTLTLTQKMRRYLRTRCLYEMRDEDALRDALDSYLRHGDEPAGSGQ